MAANRRARRSAERKRRLASQDSVLGLTDDATLEEIEATVARLRELWHRVDQRQLEPDDWAFIRALLVREMT